MGLCIRCAAAVSLAVAVVCAEPVSMAEIAHEYVRLVLAMGQHDHDYVDAYYGPAAIKAEADAAKLTLDDIAKSIDTVHGWLKGVPADGRDELSRLRHQYLE